MARRSFYVKDSELDDYQVKVINKKTDNSYIVKGCAGSGKSIRIWKKNENSFFDNNTINLNGHDRYVFSLIELNVRIQHKILNILGI
ncbi:MAG: hypothetical protein RLZZ479_581 [Bacteroidota bacterium]